MDGIKTRNSVVYVAVVDEDGKWKGDKSIEVDGKIWSFKEMNFSDKIGDGITHTKTIYIPFSD